MGIFKKTATFTCHWFCLTNEDTKKLSEGAGWNMQSSFKADTAM